MANIFAAVAQPVDLNPSVNQEMLAEKRLHKNQIPFSDTTGPSTCMKVLQISPNDYRDDPWGIPTGCGRIHILHGEHFLL